MLIYADQTILEFEKRNRIFKEKNTLFFEILEKQSIFKHLKLLGLYIETKKKVISSRLIRLDYNQSIMIKKISPRRLHSTYQIITDFSLYQILNPRLTSFDDLIKSPFYITKSFLQNLNPYFKEFNIKLLDFPKVIVSTN